MARKILKKDWTTFTDGDYSLVNNPWNQGKLDNGHDYTQSIRFDTDYINHDVTFAWNWPRVGHVVAYPEIIVGFKPWGKTGTDKFATRLDDLDTFNVAIDYDISGSKGQFNVAFDIWLSDAPLAGPRHLTTELMIWTHDGNLRPAGHKVGVYDDGDFKAQIWVANNFGDDSGDSDVKWRYIALRATEEIRTDTIDIAAIIEDLVERGLISDQDYLNGYEFGAEVTGGKGKMILHGIEHEFSTLSDGAKLPESADFEPAAGALF